MKRAAQGDYSPDPAPSHFPPVSISKGPANGPTSSAGTGQRFTLTRILEDWWTEANAAGRKISTYESYRNTISNFKRFLEHDDAGRVTRENVVAFKDYRLSTPSRRTGRIASAKTVKDSDLAALKTVFGWAVSNRKLPMNPAEGLTISLGKAIEERASPTLKRTRSYPRPAAIRTSMKNPERWRPRGG